MSFSFKNINYQIDADIMVDVYLILTLHRKCLKAIKIFSVSSELNQVEFFFGNTESPLLYKDSFRYGQDTPH